MRREEPATLIILTEVKVCWGNPVTAEGSGPSGEVVADCDKGKRSRKQDRPGCLAVPL